MYDLEYIIPGSVGLDPQPYSHNLVVQCLLKVFEVLRLTDRIRHYDIDAGGMERIADVFSAGFMEG
jgi:hypothetical protein